MTQINGQISMGLFKVMDISTKQVAGSGKGYYHMDLQDTERNTISAIVPDKVFMTTRTEEDESGNMVESSVRKFNISDAVYAKLRYSVKGEPMLDKNGDDLLDENGGTPCLFKSLIQPCSLSSLNTFLLILIRPLTTLII